MDSKGRIAIPAWVRRNIGVDDSTVVKLSFNWEENTVRIDFVSPNQVR